MKTFVYIDHFKGEVQPAAWEALGLAKSFGSAIALVIRMIELVGRAAKLHRSVQEIELPNVPPSTA